MEIKIHTRPTKSQGTAFDLYFRWQGKRYRPLLGYDLTNEEAERLAVKMVAKIQSGQSPEFAPAQQVASSPTLKAFLPVYWQSMKIKNRLDLRRPEIAIEIHLLPRFRDRPLDSLTTEDGQNYIASRLEAKAAPWTIRREWNVLMRILNLAVDFDKLDKNRLKRVQLPDVANRERVATDEELQAIQKVAPAELWRIVLVALQTGLREGKLLDIGRSWMKLRDDGAWLILPPARSRLKGTPREIPLNRIALHALKEDVPSLEDRLFQRWRSESLTVYFGRLCKRAKVHDLHFHDLRHTFATRLQNLGVSLEIRSALLGHKVRGSGTEPFGGEAMTSRYSHGGYGWNQELRRAVTLLETSYAVLNLSNSCPMADETGKTSRSANVANSREGLGKEWWSQRDSNPCLSLERAPS
jgi:integrase